MNPNHQRSADQGVVWPLSLALITTLGTFGVTFLFRPDLIRSYRGFPDCLVAPFFILPLAYVAARLFGFAGRTILQSDTAGFYAGLFGAWIIGILSGYYMAAHLGEP